MSKEKFIEEIFELAFGDDAINKDFSKEEVIERIKYYSDKALELEQIEYERESEEKYF